MPPPSPLRWFLVLLLVSLFFFSGRLESSDEILMARTAHAIATRASLHFPETYGQTFSGYGVGTPLAAVPMVWIELALRRAGALGEGAAFTLMPLTNALLFALLGVLVGGIAGRLGEGNGGGGAFLPAAALALIASPFLPASTTLYSELLTAVGLAGLAWAILQANATDHGRDGRSTGGACRVTMGLAFLFGAAAVLARVAVLPGVALVLVWGWRRGARGAVVSGASGAAAAVAVWLAVNAALRGSPFVTGYEGQEFTTPLLTGLFGLLFSPERGILIFFPLILLALLPPRAPAARLYWLLAWGFFLFSLVFHARFWTWHGGWTIGPRFLLPSLALLTPLVGLQLQQFQSWAPEKKLLAGAAFLWSLWGAVLYSALSAIGLWNELWGFHQIEARWQFEPQLSLWKYWGYLLGDGAFRPLLLQAADRLDGAGSLGSIALLGAGIGALVRLAVRTLWPVREFRPSGRQAAALMVALAVGAVILGAGALRGPRGWQDMGPSPAAPLRALRIDEPGQYSALLDLPLPGTYTLLAKANGLYTVRLDGRTVFENRDPIPQHLPRVSVEIAQPGLHLMEVDFRPHDRSPGRLNLYWTWPGEGRIMEPIGGEYVLPRDLAGTERLATALWRRKGLILAGLLALVLLLLPGGPARPGRKAV